MRRWPSTNAHIAIRQLGEAKRRGDDLPWRGTRRCAAREAGTPSPAATTDREGTAVGLSFSGGLGLAWPARSLTRCRLQLRQAAFEFLQRLGRRIPFGRSGRGGSDAPPGALQAKAKCHGVLMHEIRVTAANRRRDHPPVRGRGTEVRRRSSATEPTMGTAARGWPGAEAGTRTLTPLRAADFKSAASAIPPLRPVPNRNARRSPGGRLWSRVVEATSGFEPLNRGFADLRVKPLHHVASWSRTA